MVSVNHSSAQLLTARVRYVLWVRDVIFMAGQFEMEPAGIGRVTAENIVKRL